MLNLKYGTDPEVFAVIANGNKNYVVSPAILDRAGLIKPIEYDEKHPKYIIDRNYSWMMDGVAFELTLHLPQVNAKHLFNTVQIALNHLEDFLGRLNLDGSQLKLYRKPVVDYDPSMYDLNDPLIYQGAIFGCDTDYDAEDVEYKSVTIDVEKHPLRYGGGHIHLSGLDKLYDFCRPAIILQAITVGNFMMVNSPYPEEDKKRILTYGRPFRFRPQLYKGVIKGVEYRTPSNAWLSLPLEKIEELFFWAWRGAELLDDENRGVPVYKEYKDRTKNAINNYNVEESKQILKELENA